MKYLRDGVACRAAQFTIVDGVANVAEIAAFIEGFGTAELDGLSSDMLRVCNMDGSQRVLANEGVWFVIDETDNLTACADVIFQTAYEVIPDDV